ncbi:MAG: ATP-binding protein [Anaerolineae bacterium]
MSDHHLGLYWPRLVQNPMESRSVEYKCSETWEHLRDKVVKACLALANLRNGGYVVIGVKRESEYGRHVATGMQAEHLQTWDVDNVQQYVNKYAEPYGQLEICFPEDSGKQFVVIRVKQFDTVPVLCKKDLPGENLYRGDLLVRPLGTVESRRVQTAEEMRGVLDIAIDIGIQKFLARARRVGLPSISPSDEELFDKQMEGL